MSKTIRRLLFGVMVIILPLLLLIVVASAATTIIMNEQNNKTSDVSMGNANVSVQVLAWKPEVERYRSEEHTSELQSQP